MVRETETETNLANALYLKSGWLSFKSLILQKNTLINIANGESTKT